MEKHSEATVRAVKKFLGGMGINYEYTKEDGFCFSIGFDGCKIDPIDIQILPLDEAYILYAVSSVQAGPDRRQAMAEFICRANYGLLANGNFELDMDDGEIRYKVFIDCRMFKNSIDEKAIASSFSGFMRAFEMYGDGILDVVSEKRTPEEAAEQCEKGKV